MMESNMKHWLRFALILGFLATGLGLAGQARADSLGFAVSPPAIELTADPGQTVSNSFKIINLTDTTLTLQADRNNFVAKGEEGQVDLTTSDDLYSLAPWFTATPAIITVPPRGTQSVGFSIAVPVNAEPGGRYGSLVFHTLTGTLPNGQSGAAVKQQLATLIFLRISGAAHDEVKIASFTTDKNSYEYGPIKFSTRVQNLGNVHEKPTGTITIKDLLGRTVSTLKLDPKNVIPQAIRRTDTSWSKKLLFGRYTATLVLNNGTFQQLTAQTSFVVIPYKLIGVVLLIVIILYLLVWRNRKRFNRAFKVLFSKD